jgi:hypothetical protein
VELKRGSEALARTVKTREEQILAEMLAEMAAQAMPAAPRIVPLQQNLRLD